MAREKDISEKLLEDYNDVFADIVNNLLFDGRELVKENELENAAAVSGLKLGGGLHAQERDTLKLWKRSAVILAAFGFENQSQPDPTMPLRILSYDGAVYGSQVSRYHGERNKRQPVSPFYPVISLVLYFGPGPWRGPKTLRDCFPNLPAELEPLVPEYPLRVAEIGSLSPEQVKRFKSDFRFVADFLVQTRAGGDYVPPDAKIVHVDETLRLMGAISGDNSFEQAVNALEAEGKEEVSMCEVVQGFVNQGRAQGLAEGRAAGLAEGRAEGLAEGLAEGMEKAKKQYEAIVEEQKRVIAEKDLEIRELRLRLGLS